MVRVHERLSKSFLVTCAAVFITLHGASILLGRSHPTAATYPFLILAPALACGTLLYRAATGTGRARTGWTLWATALFLWTIGMSLSCWIDATIAAPESFAGYSDFSYFLYGIPLLLILSLPASTERILGFLFLDAVQAGLTACLIYVRLFGALPFLHQQMQPVPTTLLVSTYNVENLLLAAFATLRLVTLSLKGDVRGRYALLTAFLWFYAACAACYNALYMARVLAGKNTAGLIDIFATLPFLFLCVALLYPRTHHEQELPAIKASPVELFLDSGSPILYTLTLLALGLITLRSHVVLSTTSIVVALLTYVTRAAVLQIRYLTTQRDLSEARDQLEALSLQDALTGIPNRRSFEQTLDREWERAYRTRTSIALIILDIDHFKRINDKYGHPFGDTVLKQVATCIQSTVTRSGDIVARYGGEEFVVILVASDSQAASIVCARILDAVRGSRLPNVSITVSAGIATGQPLQSASKDALIAAADKALYVAKQNGRNRMEFAEQ